MSVAKLQEFDLWTMRCRMRRGAARYGTFGLMWRGVAGLGGTPGPARARGVGRGRGTRADSWGIGGKDEKSNVIVSTNQKQIESPFFSPFAPSSYGSALQIIQDTELADVRYLRFAHTRAAARSSISVTSVVTMLQNFSRSW